MISSVNVACDAMDERFSFVSVYKRVTWRREKETQLAEKVHSCYETDRSVSCCTNRRDALALRS
jgi:hypothetical protein